MKFFFLFIVFSIFYSCSMLVGYKELKKFDLENVNSFLSKNKFDTLENYVIDTSFVNQFRFLIERGDTTSFKYINQPLQAYYYNNHDSLVSYFVNCNAGGLSKLNWDKDNNFSQFPPISQSFMKSTIVLKDIAEHCENYSPLKKRDYTVFVFYTMMLEKQSKYLIELVLKNAMNEDAKVILINTDKLYINN